MLVTMADYSEDIRPFPSVRYNLYYKSWLIRPHMSSQAVYFRIREREEISLVLYSYRWSRYVLMSVVIAFRILQLIKYFYFHSVIVEFWSDSCFLQKWISEVLTGPAGPELKVDHECMYCVIYIYQYSNWREAIVFRTVGSEVR